jgi:hypothetical protein
MLILLLLKRNELPEAAAEFGPNAAAALKIVSCASSFFDIAAKARASEPCVDRHESQQFTSGLR